MSDTCRRETVPLINQRECYKMLFLVNFVCFAFCGSFKKLPFVLPSIVLLIDIIP